MGTGILPPDHPQLLGHDRFLGLAGRQPAGIARRTCSSPSAPASRRRTAAAGSRASPSGSRRRASSTSTSIRTSRVGTTRRPSRRPPMRPSPSRRSPRPTASRRRIAATTGARCATSAKRSSRPAAPTRRRTRSRCCPSGSWPTSDAPSRTRSWSPTSAGTRTASRSSTRSTAPTRSSPPAASRRWASARPQSSAWRLRGPADRPSRWSGTAPSARTRASSRRPSRWGSRPVWVVMNNAAFGTIAGLERKHYGSGYRLRVRGRRSPVLARLRRPRPRLRRGRRARSSGRTSSSRRCETPAASGRPTVIDVPMRNTPVMTPGEWDIERIYQVAR